MHVYKIYNIYIVWPEIKKQWKYYWGINFVLKNQLISLFCDRNDNSAEWAGQKRRHIKIKFSKICNLVLQILHFIKDKII